jgi:hypothetical protein
LMVRTALRSTTAGPSPRGSASVELLDRTGIIAASLPQRRRSELDADAGSHADIPVSEPRDKDLRPRGVIIHRRAKSWIGAVAAVGIFVVGWLGGGMFAAPQSDNAASVVVERNVVERPVMAPPAAAPAAPLVEPTPVPVTAEVPVAHRPPASSKASPPASATRSPEPRADVPAATSSRGIPQLPEQIHSQINNQVKDLFSSYPNAPAGPRH